MNINEEIGQRIKDRRIASVFYLFHIIFTI